MDPSAALKATAGAVTQKKKKIYIYMSGWSLWMNRIEN
jgi:hypothetical protein